MKKLLIVLGVIFLIIIILAAIGIGVAAVQGQRLDKDAKAYVNRAVPLILSSWDAQELLSRASPEFMQSTTQDELDKAFIFMRHKFGMMRSYQDCDGTTYINDSIFSSHSGRAITAAYTAKVIFDAGPADIKIWLVKRGDQWQIKAFHIESDVLLQSSSSSTTIIPAKDAKNHIGENAVVSGTVEEIFISKQNASFYLYLDGDIKNAQLTAVWLGTNNPPIEKLKDLIAMPISVSGKIITDQGVPEVIVNSWTQINK
jgi:hypothetical protein